MSTLNQMLYLLEEAFIGNRSWHAHELVDCGSPQRAETLEERGIGLVVGRAVEYSEYLRKARANGQDDHDVLMFLNRIKMFPILERTPEWVSLCERIWLPQEDDIAKYVVDNEPKPPGKPFEFELVTLEQSEHVPAGRVELELPPPKPKPKRIRKKKAVEG